MKSNPNRPTVLKADSDLAICVVCVQAATQYAEQVPMGAISCVGCGKYDGFKVQYMNGSVARWLFSGIDKNNDIVYTPVSTQGAWSTMMTPEKMYCVRCECQQPLDLLALNSYIWKRRK